MAKSIKTQDSRPKTKDQIRDSRDESRGMIDDGRSFVHPPSSVVHRAFSGWPMIIAWLGMLVFACHASTHMVAAGDTWVALACGRHFINHGVNTVEPFSANSHKPGPTPQEVKTWPEWAQWITDKVGLDTVKKWHPTGWVNQNWLTHVMFYWLCTTFGSKENPDFNALVCWKFAIYILAVICLFYTGVILGANPALSAVFACFALFAGRSFFDIRPQGFSNLFVACFLLIFALTTYRNVLYIWLIVPLTVFWCNVHGGYIYLFIMLAPFTVLNLLTCISKKWFVSIGLKGIYHTMAAGIVAFVAMILFNPFHLTNLTHTFIISVSKHAERWRDIHEWQPAFDWVNPVGTAVPFLVLYILAWSVFVTWFVIRILVSRSLTGQSKRRADATDGYQRPKIDLAIMIIAALTIYMAIRSRRFIPIGAFAACPIIAMLLDQVICAFSAMLNFRKSRQFTVATMPRNAKLFFTCVGLALVLFFGIWWGLKFKYIYLDPWPSDPKYNSVFMRMTASDAKPFSAGQFIRDNKLKGTMFNYWTEGGFIAWTEETDPNTGKIPLQLFMDGRAQAAYDRKAFDLWSAIMAGGQVASEIMASAKARGQDISAADYVKIGQWMDEQLKKFGVWVVLMPASVYNDPEQKNPYHAIKGLEYNRSWTLIFFDNEQKLFVDYSTPQGKQLYDGMFTGKTIYPDEYHKSLIIGHHLLLYGRAAESKKQGLDLDIKAFALNPSPAPMLEIILNAARFTELRPQVEDFCKNYMNDFDKNKADYAKQDGFRLKVEAVRLASICMERISQEQNPQEQNTKKLEDVYAAKIKEYEKELNGLFKRW
ncbi:MAG: hypothetical protein MUP16_04730 [Sedimentisphaerales bacterium]|nr:hypothetical protein [Sedimentisphaerales bacterium]